MMKAIRSIEEFRRIYLPTIYVESLEERIDLIVREAVEKALNGASTFTEGGIGRGPPQT